MKNEKGISKLVLFVVIVIIIIIAIYWARYLVEPVATVMMGGAEQAQPAIEKAKQASDAMNKVTRATEEMARKASEDEKK